MQRPLLKSRHLSLDFTASAKDGISLVSAHAIPHGNRNWIVTVKLDGANSTFDDDGIPLTTDLNSSNLLLERLDGEANRALIIKHVEWVNAPSVLRLHLFMDARAQQLNDQNLYQHILKLVSFPNQPVNQAANSVPLFLLSNQHKSGNAYGMKEAKPTPIIDYTAKDFELIRSLMITNIQRMLPWWQNETDADIGNMLVEVLAYVADYLSYRQDFAANEAYLHTARLRTSIARHARLLGYFPDEGCAPRTILTFQVSETLNIPRGFAVLSLHNSHQEKVVSKHSDLFDRMIAGGSACYETRHSLVATPERNHLLIHDYGLQEYTLFAGSTSAVLEFPNHWIDESADHKQDLGIYIGDLIVFQQTNDITMYRSDEQEESLRAHAVRLTNVELLVRNSKNDADKILAQVKWSDADALPRDFPVTRKPAQPGEMSKTTGVVFANVVEAEYGLTRDIEVPRTYGNQRTTWQPSLRAMPLQSPPVTTLRDLSVHAFLDPDPHLLTYPTIQLTEHPLVQTETANFVHTWQPTRDLLRHGQSSRVFMVDTHDDQTISLRFGAHGMGRSPSTNMKYIAHVREAAGNNGSVGVDTLTIAAPNNHLFEAFAAGLLRVNNPIPATAPRQAESNKSTRLKATEFVQKTQVCATLEDYKNLAENIDAVKEARAWQVDGEAWPTLHIAVLAKHTNVVDDTFAQAVKASLDKHRPIGRRLIVSGPTPIPIEIVLGVIHEQGYPILRLEHAIASAIGSTDNDETDGYFSSKHVSFDQTIYANNIVECLASVSGIKSLRLIAFKRLDKSGPQVEKTLSFSKGEIPMLDCQDNSAAGGRLKIEFEEVALE